jgi:hypothetical protein
MTQPIATVLVGIHLTPALRAAVQNAAKANFRSTSSEIRKLLAETYTPVSNPSEA